MTKAEIDERMAHEVYVAEGGISPPSWLKGMARSHFLKNAEYMEMVNAKLKVNVYGSIDAEALTLMSVSFQKSKEYLKEELDAKDAGDSKAMESAQNKRMREDRSYREFMKLLKLDPGNRVDVGSHGDGEDDGEDISSLL